MSMKKWALAMAGAALAARFMSNRRHQPRAGGPSDPAPGQREPQLDRDTSSSLHQASAAQAPDKGFGPASPDSTPTGVGDTGTGTGFDRAPDRY